MCAYRTSGDAPVWADAWQRHTIEVDEAETEPLAGMGLLRGHSLRVDVVENGIVRIEALA